MSAMFAALRERNYRIYWTGSVISNIGGWMQRVAQDWLVLELSGGSGAALGIGVALQFGPMLALSGVAGLVADRVNRRRLLCLTQAWLALCSVTLGVLTLTGTASVGLVYLIVLLFGAGAAMDAPARQALIPEVVGAERLPNAIALNSTAFNSARLIGPGLAGLVIHQFGSGWAILSNAVSYVAAIGALLLIDTARLHLVPPIKKGKRQIREAFAYVRGRPDLMLVLGVVFFLGTFGMYFQMTTALMATREFHRDAQSFGILGTLIAAGSLTGALIGARRSRAPRLRFFLVAAMLFAFVTITAGAMPTYLTFALLMPAVGMSSLLTLNAANTIVQMSVDPQLRGRVMALYLLLNQGGTLFGAPLMGWVGDQFGPRWTLYLGGGMVLAGLAGVMLGLAGRLDVRLLTELRPYGSKLVHPRQTLRERIKPVGQTVNGEHA